LAYGKYVVLTKSGQTICIVPSHFGCRKPCRGQKQWADASDMLDRQTCPG